jgi:C4-dicarboxylate transporter DctQ subunit
MTEDAGTKSAREFGISTWRRIERWINGINEFFGAICNVVIAFITAIIFYDVLARYVFKAPTIWVTETSVYLMALISFLGAGYCLKYNGHINVDVLVTRYPRRLFESFSLVSNVLTLVFLIVLCWQGYIFWKEAFVSGFTSGGIFDIPLWIPYVVFPLGVLLLILQLLILLSGNIRGILQR